MKLPSFHTRSETNVRASVTMALAVSRVKYGNLRRSLLAVVNRSKRSHWLTNSSNDSRARGSDSMRRTCFSTPARVASSPRSAAAKSSVSGMVSHNEYESRLAVAHAFNFGSDFVLIQNRKFGD